MTMFRLKVQTLDFIVHSKKNKTRLYEGVFSGAVKDRLGKVKYDSIFYIKFFYYTF